MTKTELSAAVDRLGALRKKIHGLTDEEKALTQGVRDALVAAKGPAVAAGKRFRAELVPGSSIEIKDMPGLAKAAGRRLLEIVSIRLTEARRVLGGEVVARFTRIVPTTKLTVTALKKKK